MATGLTLMDHKSGLFGIGDRVVERQIRHEALRRSRSAKAALVMCTFSAITCGAVGVAASVFQWTGIILWFGMILSALPPIMIHGFWSRRRFRESLREILESAGRCRECGYLQACEQSDVCAECGTCRGIVGNVRPRPDAAN